MGAQEARSTYFCVGVTGFEPAAFRSQSGCATKLRYTPRPPDALAARPPELSRTGGAGPQFDTAGGGSPALRGDPDPLSHRRSRGAIRAAAVPDELSWCVSI